MLSCVSIYPKRLQLLLGSKSRLERSTHFERCKSMHFLLCISKFLISCSFSFNYKKTSLYHLPIGKFAFFCGIPRKRFETCCFCTSTSIFFFQFLHIYPICSIGPSENVNCMYFYSAKRALKISLINGDRPIKCLEFINLNLVAIPGIMYCTNVEVT